MKRFEILETMLDLPAFGNTRNRVCLMKWCSGGEPKIDIRNWYYDENGELQPGRAAKFTEDGAMRLLLALCHFFGFAPPSVPVKPLESDTGAGTASNGDSVDWDDFFDD